MNEQKCAGRSIDCSFEKIEYGEEKEFEVTFQNFFHWAHWETVDDI